MHNQGDINRFAVVYKTVPSDKVSLDEALKEYSEQAPASRAFWLRVGFERVFSVSHPKGRPEPREGEGQSPKLWVGGGQES